MGRFIEIKLTDKQREELRSIVRRPSESAGLVRRARVVLLSDEGVSGREIALRLDLSPEHVSKVRSRFRAEGVAGLTERPKPGRTDHAVSVTAKSEGIWIEKNEGRSQSGRSSCPASRRMWRTASR